MIRHLLGIFSLCLVVTVAGCTSETDVETATESLQPTAEGAKYLLSTSPADAQDVIPMREAVENNQDVVVIGRIGGSHDPWVEGLAAFSMVDRSLAACTDIPGDTCPTPWDYCCVTHKLPDATTLVKVVDQQGETIQTSAREFLGVSELQTVVVKGKASKDDAGNITVLASAIYVDPSNPGQVKHGDGDGHDHSDHTHDDEHEHQHEGKADVEESDDSSPDETKGDS